jgi:hypothetical protein
MGGGLMQLVAYGAQDIYLTGNPQITFFKVVYRRHTNFSMECIQQTINGANAVAANSGIGSVTISRNGDLVSKVWVRCDQDTANGINGDKLISQVECEIGGQLIDRHYEEWLQVWAELSTPGAKADGYKYLTGGFSNTLVDGGLVATGGTSQQSIMVPLQFWFCRNPGLALPLIALQYHEVKLKFNWGINTDVGRDTTAATPTCEVWVDYIYLDTDERRRFAQVSHEYLIEQLQRQTESSAKGSYKLNFNHPVKEIIWTESTANINQKVNLQLNGHDRFAKQDREYFQLRQPFEYHTSVPGFNIKEFENPVLIAPIETGILTEADTPAATAATFAAASLSVHADTTAATTGGFRVGDVMKITIGGHDAALAGGADAVDSHIVQIASVSGAAPNVLTFATAIPANLFTAPTDADGLSVRIIGRTQNPQSKCSQLARNINLYSFALKPEEHQPSGTCNFSRIDNAQLNFDGTAAAIPANIYAVNYNVLRIMSGMGGLAYSN